jgi:ribosomal protein L30E
MGDIKYYSSLGDLEIITLKRTNEELGVLCKKSYMISVLCLKKE